MVTSTSRMWASWTSRVASKSRLPTTATVVGKSGIPSKADWSLAIRAPVLSSLWSSGLAGRLAGLERVVAGDDHIGVAGIEFDLIGVSAGVLGGDHRRSGSGERVEYQIAWPTGVAEGVFDQQDRLHRRMEPGCGGPLVAPHVRRAPPAPVPTLGGGVVPNVGL